MLNTLPNEWGLVISSVADGIRPTTPWGTALTPGNNTYGSYVQVLAATSAETYLMRIVINAFAVSAAARDALVTIGIDPAGGTSYVDFITDLMASCAHTYTSGPVVYEFPIRVPAGATLAAKASVNNATVGTGSVAIELWGAPSRPELVKAGSFVQTFGAVAASSRGTTVTIGTTSEGSWTQIGSALTVPLWHWEWGMGANNTTILGNGIHVDVGIGDASNKKIVINNAYVNTTTVETITKPASARPGLGAVGDIVYVRGQCGPSTPDAAASFIVYGVGG